MIKKRSPDLLGLNPVNNAGEDPKGSTLAASNSAASSGAASSSNPSSGTLSSSAPASSSSASSSSSGGLLDGLNSVLTSNLTVSTSSAASSTPTPTSTTPAPTSTHSDAPAPTSAPPTTPTPPSDPEPVAGTTITRHVAAATQSSDPDATPKGSASLSKGATTILIVIGCCVGGGAIIWTIFRKWKLRASSRFEDRLEPIDWHPSTGDNDIPGSNRPTSIASSFHSGGHDGLMRSNSGGNYHPGAGAYGAMGQAALNPIPDHDFTAGATGLAAGGYTDMARGPSPGPQMADLSRGPSVSQQQYAGYPGPRY